MIHEQLPLFSSVGVTSPSTPEIFGQQGSGLGHDGRIIRIASAQEGRKPATSPCSVQTCSNVGLSTYSTSVNYRAGCTVLSPGAQTQNLDRWSARRYRVKRACPSIGAIESFLRRSSVGAQLLAALAYDSGVAVQRLLQLRIRDFHFGKRIFICGRKEVPLSAHLAEDLRNYTHDRICGFEASSSGSGVSQSVFSQEDYSEVTSMQDQLGVSVDHIHFVGRLHLYMARKRRSDPAWRKSHVSPLSLFEKGPLIVRRGYGGSIRAYYLWRGVVSI